MADNNPFDDAAGAVINSQATAIRQNITQNVGENADTAARYQHLAKYVGVPIETVYSDPKTIEQQAATQKLNADGMVVAYPHLSKFISDDQNAAKAHDDITPLAATETAVKALPAPSAAQVPPQEISGWQAREGASERGWQEIGNTELVKGFQEGIVTAAKGASLALGGIPTIYDKAASLITGTDKSTASDWWFKHVVDQTVADAKQYELAGDATVSQKVLHGTGGLLATFMEIASTGGMAEAPAAADAMINQAPSLLEKAPALAEQVTKTMAAPSVSSALESGQQVYETTGDANAAIKSALTSYATTTASGAVPIALEGKLLTRALSGAVSGAAVGETNRRIMNLANPESMQTPFNIDEVIVNAITGSILGGVLGHNRPHYENVMREEAQNHQDALAAVDAGNKLQALGEIAAQSKLRTNRDPQAFSDYVQSITNDGHLPEIYVDATTLNDSLNQSGVTPDKLAATLPDVAKQLQEAIATKGDVKISTADYATHIAGTPLDDTLRQHLKVDPDGKTVGEGQAYLDNLQQHTAEIAKTLGEEQPLADEHEAQLKTIYDERLASLENAGRFPADVNQQYARAHTILISELAKREGMDVSKVHEMLPLNVTAEVQGRSKDLLDQKSLAEWDAFLHGLDYSKKESTAKGTTDENQFLSSFEKGTRHTDESPLLKRIRKSSDKAFDELGGEAEAGRVVKSRLGPFSGYRTSAEAIEPDSLHPDGRLEIHVYGKEQDQKGGAFSEEPALTFIVKKDGELTVDGPSQSSATFKAFAKEGWAEAAKGKDGEIQDNWTALKNPEREGKNLTLTELAPVLADVHARVRAWRGDDKVGLYWNRATGATGDISGGRQTAMYLQGERGFFNTRTKTLGLLKDADLSTYLHETGHYWLESLHQFVARPEASESLKKDFDSLLKWFDVKGDTPEARLADWNTRDTNAKREGHEKFAEGFERYLMEGKAPTPELQSLFGRFRAWLVNVYKGIAAPGEVFSPEVKSVFDRMFASEEAINEAERNRAYFPADFQDANAELLKQYHDLGQEATDQAIADMQKRTLRDLRWLSNAKGKALKALQKEADAQRKSIRDEVTKQVMEEPVNQAHQALKDAGLKPNDTSLAADLIAEQHGFASGQALFDAIRKENTQAKIEGMTEQRMLERHGDLTDAVSIERAAESAIANDARAKQMATGLKILTKSPIPVTKIQKAAKEAAEITIAGKVIKDLRPAVYSAAESRANKELLKLAPKDPAGAAQAQRNALLNNRLFKASTEAVEDVKSGLNYFKKFSKDTARAKIDVDIRDQIDDLLGRFDLRVAPNDNSTRKRENLFTWIESQVKAGMEPSITEAMLDPINRKPYREMSVEEFRGLVDTIRSMEHIGRERERITIDGEKRSLADYVQNELMPRMQERGENFSVEEIYSRPEDRGISEVRQGLDKFSSWLRASAASLKGQEFKRNQYDLHEILGPFGKAVFEPVMQANYRKVDMLKGLSDDFRVKATELGRDWQKSLTEMVDNKILLDAIASKEAGQAIPFKLSRGKLVGLAVHVGNESNFDKLTKGYNWKPEDVWAVLHEHMTAKDWDAVQTIWDLYEKHWPEQVAMYHRLGQTSPEKIEPRPFKTPFGEMRGGYANIKYDALRSRRGEKDAQGKAIDPNEGLFNRDYFSRNSTTNSAMKSRSDSYTDAIDLNFHTIERAMHESIHDLAYREALINANKVLENSEFRKQFFKTYGREDYRALQDWLGRIANSENMDRNVGALGRFLQYTRTGMVMNAIALRVSTVLKHGGSAGIKTLGYFAGGGEKFLGSRMAAMTYDYRNQISSAIEKFPEIRARLLQQDRDYRATASSLFESESLRSRAERFGHSAVAWSDMMTAVPTAWGAYDRAITVGIPENQGGTGKPMTEEQAVMYASKVVREAHGSNIESARSNIMTNPNEAFKMFTTLYGFMNNTYGQIADSIDKYRTPGLGNPTVTARTFMAIIVPALWAGYLTKGGAKEDSAASWAVWAAESITGELAGAVPFARDAAAMVEGYRHAGVIGVEAWLSTLVQAGKDANDIAHGKHPAKPISDVANAAGMGLHIPGLGQLGQTAQYIEDVESGKINPQSAWEFIHDAAVGHKSAH